MYRVDNDVISHCGSHLGGKHDINLLQEHYFLVYSLLSNLLFGAIVKYCCRALFKCCHFFFAFAKYVNLFFHLQTILFKSRSGHQNFTDNCCLIENSQLFVLLKVDLWRSLHGSVPDRILVFETDQHSFRLQASTGFGNLQKWDRLDIWWSAKIWRSEHITVLQF